MNNDNQKIKVLLCPHCFTKNVVDVDFCKKCGCPLGSMASIDPIKRILSQGWVYRRAVSGPISKLVLLAMWLIFGKSFLTSVLFLKEFKTLVDVLLSIIPVVSVIILYRVTKNYFKHKRSKKQE